MDRNTYKERVKEEISRYKQCGNVHDLPPIFHYWANKHLASILKPFGLSHVDDIYFRYIKRVCSSVDNAMLFLASIGAGNCKLEVEIVKKVHAAGIENLLLECFDINTCMVDRGKQLAAKEGVSRYLRFIPTDLNKWKPARQYHIIIAHQSLHHFLHLEEVLDGILQGLHPHGYFVTNDMIGRNGHMLWPEALAVVEKIWKGLPQRYKYNHQLGKICDEYENWDCSQEGFEGIRAQDILPLLLERFGFDLFIGFANIIHVFIGRAYGPNFNPEDQRDRALIDWIHDLDMKLIEAGYIKPTQMIAAMTPSRDTKPKVYKHLTPEFCVRRVGKLIRV